MRTDDAIQHTRRVDPGALAHTHVRGVTGVSGDELLAGGTRTSAHLTAGDCNWHNGANRGWSARNPKPGLVGAWPGPRACLAQAWLGLRSRCGAPHLVERQRPINNCPGRI